MVKSPKYQRKYEDKYSHRSWEEMLNYYPRTREDAESQKLGEVKHRPVTWSQASQNLRSHGGIGCYRRPTQVPGKDKDQSTQTKTERSARNSAGVSGDILHMDTPCPQKHNHLSLKVSFNSSEINDRSLSPSDFP